MDDDLKPVATSSYIPVALGLLGVVLGAVAIYLSVSGSGQIEEDLGKKLTAATETVAAYEQRIKQLEERAITSQELHNTSNMKIRALEEGTRNAINNLGGQMQAALNSLSSDLKEVKAGMVAQATPPSSSAPAPRADGATSAAPNADGAASSAEFSEYVVKANDLLGKIAQTHGVSLDALLKANPGVVPERLKIGQKLRIPKK